MTRTFFGLRARVLARFSALAGAAALVVGLTPATSTIGAAAATQQTYIVLAKQETVSAHLLSQLRASGATVVASYAEIGVVIVKAGDTQFVTRAKASGASDATVFQIPGHHWPRSLRAHRVTAAIDARRTHYLRPALRL